MDTRDMSSRALFAVADGRVPLKGMFPRKRSTNERQGSSTNGRSGSSNISERATINTNVGPRTCADADAGTGEPNAHTPPLLLLFFVDFDIVIAGGVGGVGDATVAFGVRAKMGAWG